MKRPLPIIFVVIAIVLLVVFANRPETNNTTPTPSNSITISAPKNTAVKGKTYVINWPTGKGRTDIFLINRAYETEGVSASIADRVYNIENNGKYSYTFPKNIPDGEYKLQIGEGSSNYFNVAAK